LPEGHVQIKPLTYSGNDLSASMNFWNRFFSFICHTTDF
jgi:hypothetical protein